MLKSRYSKKQKFSGQTYETLVVGSDHRYIGSTANIDKRPEQHKEFIKEMFSRSIENDVFNIDKPVYLYSVDGRRLRNNALCYVLYIVYIEMMGMSTYDFMNSIDNIIDSTFIVRPVCRSKTNKRRTEQRFINKYKNKVLNMNNACESNKLKKLNLKSTYEQRCRTAAEQVYDYLMLVNEIMNISLD